MGSSADASVAPIAEQMYKCQILFDKLDDMDSHEAGYKDKINEGIAMVKTVYSTVLRMGVFSSNEELEDVNTTDLKYAMCPFYLAELTDRLEGEGRVEELKRVNAFLDQFLNRCDNLKLLTKEDREVFHRKSKVTPTVERTEKVSRYRREIELKTTLKSLIEQREHHKKITGALLDDDNAEEDEVEREYTIALIKSAILTAINNIGLNKQEMMMAQLHELHLSGEKTQEPEPQRKKGPTVTVIEPNGVRQEFDDLKSYKRAVDNKVNNRINARDLIFRNPNPPTMSPQEYLEEELRNGKLLKTKAPEKIPDSDDESDSERNDARLRKQREWDNWKDDNEKGSGNMMNR